MVVFHLVKKMFLLVFSLEYDDSVGGGDGVFVDGLDALVDHLVPLMMKFFELIEMVVKLGLAD